jgi:hypothetical protein
MSRQYIENTHPTVGGPACSYATLSHYNRSSRGARPPIPRGNTSGFYNVPVYGAPGYNTLKYSDECSCTSYPHINGAYKSNGGNCSQKYVKKLCQ